MSPKNQPRADPRVAPKEMIVTRRKSALQRRQLRDKDRSMRSITQLLKSPTRSSQSPKKHKVSPKAKSPKKKPQSSPGPVKESPKLERRPRVEKDRVWLKPKHNFKMVAKTNKRKLCVPQKEADANSLIPTQPSTVPSRDEDSDSLDEEGLMEILTCPSPVWWEDPPDPTYEEDAICTRPPSPEQTIKHIKSATETFTNSKSNKKQDQKFMNKRKKLESVLGCIKNRKKIENDDDDRSDDLDTDFVNDEMLANLENIDIPIEPDTNEMKIEKEDKCNELSNEIANQIDHNDIKDVKNVVPQNLPPLQRNPMHSTSSNKNVMTQRNITQTNCDSQENDTVFDRNEIKINAMDSPVVDKNESKDLDTISDTNIKFIDKVEDKELDDTSQLILDKIKKFFQEKEKRSNKEYITVYKIVDNDEKQEVKNDDQSKINYFYKKCKNVRKKCDAIDKVLKNSESKTLALPNSEVKYCFKCSSIFETKECHYCARFESKAKECVCEKTQLIRDCSNDDLKNSDCSK